MSAIDLIKQELTKHPEVTHQDEDDMLIIPSQSKSGFEIIVLADPNEYTLFFGNCHAHFETERETVKFALWGLTHRCRVREVCRGNKPYKWHIESEDGGTWHICYTTSRFFAPFWKKKTENIYQNNIIKEY